MKYESEVFVQVGAWKNLEELEDSLLLHELFLLYRALGNEYTKTIKASAMAFGAEVDFEDDWYDPAPPEVANKTSIAQMPISLGYEMVE